MDWLGKLFGSETNTNTTLNKKSTAKDQGKEVSKMAKDPICGMTIDEKKAAGKSEYNGKTYYFCAPGCKKAFDANPAKYAGGEHKMGGHGGHNHMM